MTRLLSVWLAAHRTVSAFLWFFGAVTVGVAGGFLLGVAIEAGREVVGR